MLWNVLRIRSETPDGLNWEKLRPQAEIELLGSDQHKDLLSYSLLSIFGDGLSTYGECTILLRESMIAHRCSCFEENTAVFWKNNKGFPPGKRSDWDNRYKLCVAKLGGQIDKTTQSSRFSKNTFMQGKDIIGRQFHRSANIWSDDHEDAPVRHHLLERSEK